MSTNEANSHYNSLQVDLTSHVRDSDPARLLHAVTHDRSHHLGGSGGGDLGNVSNPYLGWKYDSGPERLRPNAQRRSQLHL